MLESSAELSTDLLEQLKEASGSIASWQKHESMILTRISGLLRKEEGLQFLYDNIEAIVEAGIFRATSWEDIEHLVPSLVKGTLCGGYPMVVYESLNEIRMLKLALGEWTLPGVSQESARQFVQEAIIASFDLAVHKGGEETRHELTPNSLRRLRLLFAFILKRMPVESFKDKLEKEIQEISAQRPIVTKRLRELLHLVNSHFKLDAQNSSDTVLKLYIEAAFNPTDNSRKSGSVERYKDDLLSFSPELLEYEACEMAYKMVETGLVSEYHVVLLRLLAQKMPALVPTALNLDSHGQAEYERHYKLVVQLIDAYVLPGNEDVIYGLSGVLNRNLLSRRVVLHSLKKLLHIKLNPSITHRLSTGQYSGVGLDPKVLLVGGILQMLGHPLGVGQGMNPTCQSARGLSMWSRHSPGKLLEMLVTAAVADEVKVRYQGELISSSIIQNQQQFDLDLDPVSVVLVPLLDNIYKQMIQKAQLRFPFEDPHITVNPAFYGLWIPTGFISCYNSTLNAIQGYDHFVRLFYAVFHPEYNEGFRLVYPLPVGIFVTTSRADFLGYHAISLLRFKRDPSGEMRAYFFNPNNDGRQDWGQGIKPTVSGNGERHGESSLPFHQLLSRIYAYHYNSVEGDNLSEKQIPDALVEKVKQLAKESWGKKYYWD